MNSPFPGQDTTTNYDNYSISRLDSRMVSRVCFVIKNAVFYFLFIYILFYLYSFYHTNKRKKRKKNADRENVWYGSHNRAWLQIKCGR